MGLRRPHETGGPRPARRLFGSSAGPVRFFPATSYAFVVLTAAAVVTVATLACSDAVRYRTLTFFFDGVPEPGAGGAAPGATDPLGSQPEAPGESAKRVVPTVYKHPPYEDSRCGTCHDPDGGQLYRTVAAGLCQSCHSDLPGEARYLHGPVAVNDCLFCHHYHYSAQPRLLLSESTELCFRCHARDDLTEGSHHAGVPDRACIECHEPHGEDNPYLLKPIEGWGEYVHGPVAVGDCGFCHRPRASGASEPALDEVSTLCFRCHEREDLSKGQHHATIDERSCVKCHDPHGGDNGFFLRRNEP